MAYTKNSQMRWKGFSIRRNRYDFSRVQLLDIKFSSTASMVERLGRTT
jgi:hypothetical protein